MVTKEELEEQFDAVGCSADNDEVIKKCIEMCNILEKDAEQFVLTWVAFSASHYENFDLTLPRLEEMLKTEKRNIHKDSVGTKSVQETPISRKDIVQNFENEELLEIYGCKLIHDTPKSKRQRSPEEELSDHEAKKRALDSGPSPVIPINQITPKQRRENSGKILLSFGRKVNNWKNANKTNVSIAKSSNHVHAPSDMKYMFELLSDKMAIHLSVCEELGRDICAAWQELKKVDISYCLNARQKSQKLFRTFGRIRCDTKKQGKASNIVYLESCKGLVGRTEDIPADRLPLPELDLDKLPGYSFFPGQIVAVECTNPTGNTLVVKEVFADRKMKYSEPPNLSANLRLIVAAGPFTSVDNLNYEPLWDLMEHCAEEEPHVLVLIGPFVEYNHSKLKSVKNVTFQEQFEKVIQTVMDKIKGKCTQVVLVSSHLDAHHDPIYPTPEYHCSRDLKRQDLHLMPDPCTLCINGLNIGITSVDSVKHLGHTEITRKPLNDKLSRLANYILTQGCFYPLYPPAEEMSVDSILWKKHAFMDQLPHLLILPSDMRHFCKSINGTVVVNTERLHKRTYARIDVQPSANNAWSHEQVSCEILKV